MITPVALPIAKLWVELIMMVIDTAGIPTWVQLLLEAFKAVVTLIAVIRTVPATEVIFNTAEAVLLAVALATSGVTGWVVEEHFVLEDVVDSVGVLDFVFLWGFVWVISYDVYRAEVVVLVAPAVAAGYALFAVHWAVFGVEFADDAALAVVVTPLRIDFSS